MSMSWLHQLQQVLSQYAADVVQPTFGPLARDHLILSSSSASILVSNSTAAIIAALPPLHPVSSLLLPAFTAADARCGDGTAALILMLNAALHHISSLVSERAGGSEALQRKAMRQAVRGLAAVEAEWMRAEDGQAETRLLQEMRAEGEEVKQDFSSLLNVFSQLLQTQLAGKSSPAVQQVLAQCILDCIRRSHVDGREDIAEICSAADSVLPIVIAAPASAAQSRVLPGLVLDYALAARGMPAVTSGVRLCVLRFSLSPSLSDATVAVSDAAAYTDILNAAERLATSAFTRLQASGCNVIISSSRQHQSVLQLCQQSRIALVQGVSAEDVERICRFTGAIAAFSLFELASLQLGQAAALRQLSISSRVCLHLETSDASTAFSPPFRPHTLLLAAPSDGIGRQYRQLVRRGFAVLRQFVGCFTAGSLPPFVVGGAGAVELALSLSCSARWESRRHEPDALGWRIMAAALLAVPQALFKSAAAAASAAGPRFVQLLAAVKEMQQTRAADGRGLDVGFGQRHSSSSNRARTSQAAICRFAEARAVLAAAVLSAPASSDIDAWEQRLAAASINPIGSGTPTRLRLPAVPLPPLLSITSAVAAEVVQSPACIAHRLSSLLSLLLSLLRVDALVHVSRIRRDTGTYEPPSVDEEDED